MPEGKGIHPREAAQHHCEVAPQVLKQLIETTQISLKDVDAIGFSAGPGLGPALRTGATVARALAITYNKPLIPVHHAIGHIEIASFSTGASDPLIVLVSGGHTTISAYGGNYWRIFGETEDITLGNLFDMFARKAGLSSPGGPVVESLASAGKKFLGLPYVVKGTDVSYSGILSAAIRMLQKGVDLEDLCYSIQEIAFAMLAEVTERALAHTEKKEVLLTGGVAANIRLQEIIRIAAEEQNAAFHVVPKAYSGDCGAQIAWTGLLAYQSGVMVEAEKSYVKPRWRLDCVKIPWR
jgi:N6-L-threonylcarbamoyladenine synthase